MNNHLISYVEQQTARDINEYAFFKAGDTISVSYKIVEGAKERIQVFRGDVIQIKGTGSTKTFTVRKISHGVGVERVFAFNSPSIAGIENLKKGRVRRARLYYIRELTGKSARIREKQFTKKLDASAKGTIRRFTWAWQEKMYK